MLHDVVGNNKLCCHGNNYFNLEELNFMWHDYQRRMLSDTMIVIEPMPIIICGL